MADLPPLSAEDAADEGTVTAEAEFDVELEDALTETLASIDEPPVEESHERRITPYAQTRIGALSAFEDLTQETRQDLQSIGLTLAKVISTHHLTREFLAGVHADIHRTSETELTNARLSTENRRLQHQLDDARKALSEREAALEAHAHSEVKLLQDMEALRNALSEARLEAIDSGNAVVALESERADLTTALAAKSLSAEKLARENEATREKNLSLSVELDSALKAAADVQRRLDELAAVHASDTGRLSETLAKLANAEQEIARLQKQHDLVQASLEEAHELVGRMEMELQERDERHAGEIQAFKGEIQALNKRLQDGARVVAEKNNQIEALNGQLANVAAEKRLVAEKLEALKAENERDKRQLSAAFANFSQLNVLQASEHVMLESQMQEAEELRREIDGLKSALKRLTPYERLHNGKTRPAEAARKAEGKPRGEGSGKPVKGAA